MKNYILYGFGGHGRVIKDAINKLGATVVHIFDNEHPYRNDIFPDAELIIAIGNNDIRAEIASVVQHKLGIIIHPTAVIATDVVIGVGTVVLANAVIQTGAVIGKNCIINANVTIDHDVQIANNVSIYPGAYIGGEAKITECKTINANFVVPRNSIY
nr:transferase [uncultured Flavobacterium sp.]